LRFALLWVGIFIGLSIKNAQSVATVQVLIWPVGFLSSAFVATSTMPNWLGAIAQWNPISSTATAARSLFDNPDAAASSWIGDHALVAAVIWPAVLIAVFLRSRPPDSATSPANHLLSHPSVPLRPYRRPGLWQRRSR